MFEAFDVISMHSTPAGVGPDDTNAGVLVDRLVDVHARIARLEAEQAQIMTQLVTTTDPDLVAKNTAEADKLRFDSAVSEVAGALAFSTGQAQNRIAWALSLQDYPATRAVLAEGRLDRDRAKLITDTVDEVTDLNLTNRADLDRAIAMWAPGRTRAEILDFLRRALINIDPTHAQQRTERSREGRCLGIEGPAGESVLYFGGIVPAEIAVTADTVLDALADGIRQHANVIMWTSREPTNNAG